MIAALSPRSGGRGQAMVEFAIVLPGFLLLILGMLEFGFLFSHNLTLEYATREGARTGAALSNGGSLLQSCGVAVPDPDPYIVEAVERVLTSPGSPVDINGVSQIKIFKANPTTGQPVAGFINTWTNTGANSYTAPDGQKLNFSPPGSQAWPACSRLNSPPPPTGPDSIGVSLSYSYTFVTPLSAVVGFFGSAGPASLPITDRTVMALNPTK